MITIQKEHIVNNNSHEFHVFWVVIMPKTLNWHVVSLARVTNKFYEILESFQDMIWINWWQKRWIKLKRTNKVNDDPNAQWNK